MDGKYGMMNKKLLADIGNTHFHIFNGKHVEHLLYKDAISKYATEELLYICVQHELSKTIEGLRKWKNISSSLYISGQYDTMGVDRKALCLSRKEGIFVDAGSAITVDIVEDGKYMGGFILPGIKAYLESYKGISSVLDVNLDKKVNFESLPSTTKEQISYGIIASIKALIDKHSKGKKLYFTGGDGKLLSEYFEEATYDEMLIFEGIQKALENNNY